MAQQEQPLYDFPEPTQALERRFQWHQRGQGSLRSISILDRLLLTVPVWLQLSINPATALHILQREPPGTFLVRKSRTSQKNVLCVRVADDTVPSFVQQFGIKKDRSTLNLETSAISFPDLPRLISFYCVSRDVLPFPLELPEAIAKATSHKELESISHMGIEFWSSQLNVRGPPKPRTDEEKTPAAVRSASPAAPQTDFATKSNVAPHPHSDNRLNEAPEPDASTKTSDPNQTLFHEFCPITTRSPRELNCGSGLGALCFINPLFLQSQNTLCRRRMFKHSLKVRVSTETSTLLSPPLAPPPPPPIMPKTKGRCKGLKGRQGCAQPSQGTQVHQVTDDLKPLCLKQMQDTSNEGQGSLHLQSELQKQDQAGVQTSQSKAEDEDTNAQLPEIIEHLQNDYMKPSPIIHFSHVPSLSPYQSPSTSPMAPPLFPKAQPSPTSSPSLSPYHSPSVSPKVPLYLSPHSSPSISPLPSPPSSPLTEHAQQAHQETLEEPAEEEERASKDEHQDGDVEAKDLQRKMEEKEDLQMMDAFREKTEL